MCPLRKETTDIQKLARVDSMYSPAEKSLPPGQEIFSAAPVFLSANTEGAFGQNGDSSIFSEFVYVIGG